MLIKFESTDLRVDSTDFLVHDDVIEHFPQTLLKGLYASSHLRLLISFRSEKGSS